MTRCPNGSRKNPKTRACEKYNKKTQKTRTIQKMIKKLNPVSPSISIDSSNSTNMSSNSNSDENAPDDEKIVAQMVVDKIQDDYGQYHIFDSAKDIYRYESADHGTYFYDNVNFWIEHRDIDVSVNRYLLKRDGKKDETKIKYTYTYKEENTKDDDGDDYVYIQIMIVKHSSSDKSLTPDELKRLKILFPDETDAYVSTLFDITRKIGNLVKKLCKKENVYGYY